MIKIFYHKTSGYDILKKEIGVKIMCDKDVRKTEVITKEIPVSEYFEKYVDVETFLACCKECHNYGTVWACPPYDFDVRAYWKRFTSLYLTARKMYFPEGTSQETAMAAMAEEKARMSEELFDLEAKFPGAVSLSAGSCSICGRGNCTRPAGQPCRFPDRMRYSIEALGGNVGMTVSRLMGIELEWMEEGKVPSYFVLVGGILKP